MKEWRQVEEFPDYEVSELGEIRNIQTQHHNGTYNNGSDVLQVSMRRAGRPYIRAVHRVVAEAFLDPHPEGGRFVPFHIDRDWMNCAADNLQWKPLWWAARIARQDKQTIPRDNRPIRMHNPYQEFDNALECAKAIGGLEDLVLLTAQNQHGRTYMGSAFEFIWD